MLVQSSKNWMLLIIVLLALALSGCKDVGEDDEDDSSDRSTTTSSSSVPSSHTKSKDGYMHHPQLKSPEGVCEECHGADLRGASAPSCYSCHGKRW